MSWFRGVALALPLFALGACGARTNLRMEEDGSTREGGVQDGGQSDVVWIMDGQWREPMESPDAWNPEEGIADAPSVDAFGADVLVEDAPFGQDVWAGDAPFGADSGVDANVIGRDALPEDAPMPLDVWIGGDAPILDARADDVSVSDAIQRDSGVDMGIPRMDAPITPPRDGGIDTGIPCVRDSDCPDDGLFCNGAPVCVGGRCVLRIPSCDDGIPCTLDRCEDPRGCVHEPDDRACPMGQRCDLRLGCVMSCTPTEALCNNRVDDDCDMRMDCDDPDCAFDPACRMCVPTAMTEIDCRNMVDDDCDGFVDCGDPECASQPHCRGCMPRTTREWLCRDRTDDDCDGLIDCRDPDCSWHPECRAGCMPSGRNELGIAACTNLIDDDCDGRADCDDPDCRPFGPAGECCNGRDDNGNALVDEFTCRCFSDNDCVGIGSLDQTCWESTVSICAPICNFYGGDAFCRELRFMRCNPRTGECTF
ncbi:MAG: hypothetical protein RMJ84_12490 [Sandaracinaceae bacterium]|nr:hypothetical protein [Sandaracinaceae bacterium]